MLISGGLAGLVAVNEIMGVQQRLLLEFTAGAGFIGIAVALMGRSHPVGIVLASILFGVLYQGGTELAFEMPAITRDMIVTISGLVILFAGALDGLFRQPLGALFSRARGREAERWTCSSIGIAIFDSGVRLAVPLLFACLAGLWSERSGVVDIGLEGKMLVAAFAGAPRPRIATGSAWIGLAAGIVASVVFALVHGFAAITQRGNQIVSGVAINMLAAGLTALIGNAWYSQGGRTPPLEGADALRSRSRCPFADALRGVPVIGPLYADVISGHTILVYVAVAAVIADRLGAGAHALRPAAARGRREPGRGGHGRHLGHRRCAMRRSCWRACCAGSAAPISRWRRRPASCRT